MSEHKVAGLAKTVREQTDKSEDFDLDNYSEDAAGKLMTACFAQPHPAETPIRCTFVIGGGKEIRGRYDPQLYRGIAAALKAIGYEEDNGAAIGSLGAFKSQHDTGRNVKLIHVFPTLHKPPEDAHGGAGGEASGAAVALDADSPLYRLIAAESVEAFAALCAEGRVVSYAQLSRLNKQLAPYLALLKHIDAQMMGGQPLAPAEEAWAAIATAETLAAKLGWLQAAMKAVVEKGELSGSERRQVLESTEPKLAALEVEMATAQSEGKEARAAKLGAQREAILALRASAERSKPPNRALPPAVAAEVASAWAACLSLKALEASAKHSNQLLTLEQARQVGQLPELEARIAAAAEGARGWFESDEELTARVALAKANGAAEHKKKAAKQAQRASGTAGWSTVGDQSKALSTGKNRSKAPVGKSGAFAALAIDD
jgi:hypothetical protein